MARRTGEGLDLRQSRSRKAPVVATATRGEGDAIGWEGRLAEAPQFRGKPSPGKPGRNDTPQKKEECGKPFRGKPFRGKPFLRGKPFRGTPFRGTPGRTGHPEGKVTCSEGM